MISQAQIAELQRQQKLTQGYNEIKSAGGVKVSDGSWVMPNQIETNAQGEVVVKGKPHLKGINPDGSPLRPENIQVVDQNGNLKKGQDAKFSQVDGNSLEGYNMLKNLAKQNGPTDIAKAQQTEAGLQQSQGLDAATANAAGVAAQARSGLAMRGGASSGAKQNLARMSMKDALMARQGVNQQFTGAMNSIASQDANRKMDLIKDFGNAEGQLASSNNDIANKQVQFNKQLQGQGIQDANKYRMDAYTGELDKWGAREQADAQRGASSGGGGGCCFIFMEARYGNGTMDQVVRRFRDEHMTEQNKRGYYKLSEVLVPLMRKSKLLKFAVRMTMTDPLVAYGKAYYGGSKLGFIFAPITTFWLKTFDYLGKEHEFIRENGEVV